MVSKLREGLRIGGQQRQSKLNGVKREWREAFHRCFQLKQKAKMLDLSLRRIEDLIRIEEKKEYELTVLIGQEKGKDCSARRRRIRTRDSGTYCLLRELSFASSLSNFYAYYCRLCRLRNKKNLEVRILARKLKGSKD